MHYLLSRMTNIDIQQEAARCAAEHTTAGTHLDPDEAWQQWSAIHGVSDPGARLLFEYEYALCRREALWWQLLSAASPAKGWKRVLGLVREMRTC
jgi:hypothetical protein